MGKKEKIEAFLGKDTEFEGKISFKGSARIDGKMHGEIYTEDTLIVGHDAVIDTQKTEVGSIIVYGRISGEIYARERIEIKGTGTVVGNITTSLLVIEEGAHFEGNCRMGSKEDKVEEKVKRIEDFHQKDRKI